MSEMQTVSDYTKAARAAIAAGHLDEAETLTKQAHALKGLEGLEPKIDTSQRLPFPANAEPARDEVRESASASALKSVYIKKYGGIEASTEQVMRELYAGVGIKGAEDYYTLRALKFADLTRYCKTGVSDSRLSRLLLYTPEQVVHGIMADVSVGESNYSFKATMVEAQDQLGGFLVPEDFRLEIVQRLPGLTVVRPLASKYNTNRDRVTFIVRRGGNKRYIGNIRSTQSDESPANASATETNALWGEITIPVHVNLANVPVSKSLLEDSGLDLLNEVLMPEFTAQAAIKEDEQFLTGSGVKEPQGIVNGTAANGAPVNTDVSVQVSGNASALTFDGFVNTPYNLAGQYRMRNKPSVGWAFTSTTAGLLAKLKNSDGEYLWREMYGNNAVAAPDTLRGFKVMESEALPEVAANTYPVIFGDFEGYRIVDRVGMSVERYSDSNTAATDSVIFYLRRRYGGQVAEGYKLAAMKIST